MLLVACGSLQVPINAQISTPTPTPTPTLSCSPDLTLDVMPARTWSVIGETLTVTITKHATEGGCYYATYDLTLDQRGDDAPIFEYASSPIVGPPVSYPVAFTLTAVHTGSITLKATAYGEIYFCDSEYCFWQWAFVYGESDLVTVWTQAYETYLPLISKGCLLP